jgi:hypothetical protein
MRQAHKKNENNETNQDIGLSRGGRNTKIHAVVDALLLDDCDFTNKQRIPQ